MSTSLHFVSLSAALLTALPLHAQGGSSPPTTGTFTLAGPVQDGPVQDGPAQDGAVQTPPSSVPQEGKPRFEDTRLPEEYYKFDPTAVALPTAGYDKTSTNGVFVRSPDGEFEFRMGGYTQLRYNANWRTAAPGTGSDFTNGASVNRTRFFFTGHYTKTFGYHFRTNTSSSGDTELLVGYLQLNASDEWLWRIGRQFMALSREDWMFAQDTLTTEFSPNDFTFAIGTSNGIKVHHMDDAHRTWLALHNGAFGGKEDFPSDSAADLAVTARHEWQAAGRDWSVWDDLVGRPGRAHGVLLGAGAGYQYRDDSAATVVGNAAQLNLDASFNGDGYQGMVAGSATWIEPQGSPSYFNYGLLAQYGHFFDEEFQGYGQFNWLSPGDEPGDLIDFRSLALGVNWFPFAWTNRWKFSFEGGYLFDAIDQTIVAPSGSLGWLAADEGGQTYLRLQAQFGF